MKKKLLSLVLAGAMVASTSVSAFASDSPTSPTAPTPVSNGQIDGRDDKEYTTDVKITGKVMNEGGNLPTGTLSVTVSTAASFVVDQNGNLEGGKINVKNNGDQSIDVYAEKFIDTKPEEGIKVVKKEVLGSHDRTNVNLTLTGTDVTLYLKSEKASEGNGIYKEVSLDNRAKGEELKLTSLGKGQDKDLELEGNAGKENSNIDGDVNANGLSKNFTLRLRIKKSDTN